MTDSPLNLIWKNTLKEIESTFSQAQMKTWFHGSRLSDLKPGKAEISVENTFSKNVIKKYAEERLVASLSKHAGFPVQNITYLISEVKTKDVNNQGLFDGETTAEATDGGSNNNNRSQVENNQTQIESNLNPRYTLDNFIVGNKNRLAHAVSITVAQNPGKVYNPLYLYGGVGLGKTHLMQAIGNAVIAREPQKKVLYVSCEQFINEFVACLKSGKIDSFKKKYRTIDLFLIDDIQFIAGKDGTQEEFFHTFNTLYETGKQIILTSDKTPSEIKNLEERLSSRFNSGMIADIQPPDFETRQAILLSKCQEKGVYFSNEITSYIAEALETNIREMEGVITTIQANLLSENIKTPTIADIRRILNLRYTPSKPSKKNRLDNVFEIICEFYQIDIKDLKGPCRQKEFVKPRQITMYLMKHDLGMTFPSIGREIGDRDHTTVMYAVDKIEKEIKKIPEFLEEIENIKQLYYAKSK